MSVNRLWMAGLCVLVAGALACRAQDEVDAGWKKSAALGLTLTSGNSESLLGTAALTAEREVERHAVRMSAEGTYGETEVEMADGVKDDEVTAQTAKGNVNYKLKGEPMYAYADATLLHDKVADVDYRLLVGPGIGVYAVKTETMKLELDVGVAWVKEEVAGVEDDYLAYRAGERFELQISETAKLWQSFEFVPKADDFDDYLLTAEVGIEAAVSTRVNLRVVAQDKYDSTPAPGQDENDIMLTSGLAISL